MSAGDLTREAVGTVRTGPEAADRAAESPAGPPMSYVYGVGRDDGSFRRLVRTMSGVDGHGVRLVAGGGLVALTSPVPGEVFDEAALRAQLEDLARLEAIARAHHAVVDAAFAEAVVLPLRLATVYLDESRVADMLAHHRGRFTESLAWLDGHVELGVKVHADPEAMAPPAAAPRATTAGASSPGRAYLEQRRQRRRSTEDLYRAAGAVAVDVTNVAQALARATVVHRPQRGELSGRRGVNLTNHAYLVPADDAERFRAEVGAVVGSAPGVEVEVTGPWAPYSFAAPGTAEAGAEGAGGDGNQGGDGAEPR
ncbi:GvpL/GvpF family gas vesicle protein [Streptomyces sp. Je 1-79]|uniref:GvpL/GvpF family gas vesicle protein n=1 Tax=Streptomyces sp. Je 1-79 TaxID=2943847 RepID=UPI0021A360BE|nr:GvpL/GvpF family gas vesicle protein [Streptomyces sp. Je 1-79]MCT4353922.1 GvpL/GvpF family gas vesicle protein [Streptomyces sp. Je 1-79]